MACSYKKIKTDPVSSFLKNFNKDITPDNIRNMFHANRFDLPSVDTEKTPKGYYDLVDKYFNNNKEWIIDYKDGSFSIAIDYFISKKKSPLDFFFSMTQHLTGFTKDKIKILSIRIQKTPYEPFKNNFLHVDTCAENTMRLIICVKDKTFKTSASAKLGPKKSKQIEIYEEDSYGVCVFPNLSEITLNLQSKKPNGTILPNCYYIIIDFTPSAEIIHVTQNYIHSLGTRDIGKSLENIMNKIPEIQKNFSPSEITKKMEGKIPGMSQMLQSFTNNDKTVKKGKMKDENGQEVALPIDTREMENNYLEKFKSKTYDDDDLIEDDEE